FGEGTERAVRAAQELFGLAADGVVGELTWNAIYNAYRGIIQTLPSKFTEGLTLPYPGFLLRQGAESEEVRVMQEYLNYISQFIDSIPSVTPTGYFGTQTQESVIALQRLEGLPANGVVGALTWEAITRLYSDLYSGNRWNDGQYPGYTVGN
ncbi:MAG: peptidoglycan-binding protein, partial [Clostridia bacterium]|nr:peptidoglycan-binding protein [Clostridia bacterium]